ncbi:hypothetical protein IPA_07885 [Ignicoccus pacificus DSM 13166]|uniref:Uncharacterized protein n=1 Tax=Ignicoccus pacificus DSM 13166 TaxID=940294 RepID=A0A977KBW1_9CREN|nr:hypothetical protein IPA_07885 [Ignicoccus pacificus DSM 13166]
MLAGKILACKASPEEVKELFAKYLGFVDYLEGGGVKAIQALDENQLAEVRCTEKVTEIYLTTSVPEGLWEELFGEGGKELKRCLGERGYVNVARSHVSPKLFVTAEGTKGRFEALVTPEGVKAKGTCPFKGVTRIAIDAGINVKV